MGIVRKVLFGAALVGAYRYVRPQAARSDRRIHGGLSAVFPTREQADLAVEHLVQEHRVDRSFIYVEPVGDHNSAGTQVSGGDHASGRIGAQDRSDGSLHGAIKVTVALGQDNEAVLTAALREAGASDIESF